MINGMLPANMQSTIMLSSAESKNEILRAWVCREENCANRKWQKCEAAKKILQIILSCHQTKKGEICTEMILMPCFRHSLHIVLHVLYFMNEEFLLVATYTTKI